MSRYIVVFITAPQNQTKKIVNFILGKKLAACVNVLKNVDSFYWWKGKICNDKESLLIIKTTKKIFKNLTKEIKKIHPYKVPEIISLQIIEGNDEYLDWIKRTTEQ